MDSEINSELKKTVISDHFAIFWHYKSKREIRLQQHHNFQKKYDNDTISDFKYLLKYIAWTDVFGSRESSRETYDSSKTKTINSLKSYLF